MSRPQITDAMLASKKSPYEEALLKVIRDGSVKTDRTGTGTISYEGIQMRFDLSEGFPLVTTKKVFFRGVVEELLWLLDGSTDNTVLREKGIGIWDAWADEDGQLGRIYGAQWRDWIDKDGRHHDQVQAALDLLVSDPDSRRIIVNAWNPGELDQMALTPCHAMFQFIVRDGRLTCVLTQRSADMVLGVPFNIASYALLTTMVAQAVSAVPGAPQLVPGELVWNGGDCHVYANHYDQVVEQLSRDARPFPAVAVSPAADLFSHSYEDFELLGYDPHPAISAPVAV